MFNPLYDRKNCFSLRNPKVKGRVYSTEDSQVVTHQKTNPHPLYGRKNSFSLRNPKVKRRVYSTEDSQVVTHQKTNPAQHCLTSETIRQDRLVIKWV